jgi:hypothetical protein
MRVIVFGKMVVFGVPKEKIVWDPKEREGFLLVL